MKVFNYHEGGEGSGGTREYEINARRVRAPRQEEEEEEEDAVSYIVGAIDGRPRFAQLSGCWAFQVLMKGVDARGGRVAQVHRKMIRLRTVTYYWPYTVSRSHASLVSPSNQAHGYTN